MLHFGKTQRFHQWRNVHGESSTKTILESIPASFQLLGGSDSFSTYFRMKDISICAITTAMPMGTNASGSNLIVPAAMMMRARGAFRKAPGTAASMAPTQSAIGISGEEAMHQEPRCSAKKDGGEDNAAQEAA